MKKQSVRTEKTRSAIIEAFWGIYGTKPISSITVSDVTRHAGVHRSTFYLYFPDIFALLSQAETELLDDCEKLVSSLESSMNDSTTISNKLVDFYRLHLSKLNSLLGAKGDPGFLFEMKKRMIPIIFRLMCIPEDDEEMKILMDYMITAMLTLLTYSYNNLPSEPIEKTLRRVHGIMSLGIIPLIEARTESPALGRLISRRRQGTDADSILREIFANNAEVPEQ